MCQVMIEKHGILPIDLCVAGFTLRTERAFVGFVVGMTRVAVRFQRDFEDGIDMAVVAFCLQMSAQKPVLGIGIVVENRFGPHGTYVAGIAFGAVVFLMVVIFEVTGNACAVRLILKRVLRVAFTAGDRGVFALKRKFGVTEMVKT